MIHRTTLTRVAFSAMTLSMLVGGTLYYFKYRVGEMRTHLRSVNSEIMRVTDESHVLKAEWGHLNHPDRLKALNNAHGSLNPVNVIQMASIETFMQERKDFTNTMLASID